jgi:hypothetical protein
VQPAPLALQLTAVFEVPVTFVVKSCVPDAGTEALVGLMLNKTATAATIVTLAEADLVGSATLFAVTVTTGDEGRLVGVTYSTLAEIVPHAAPAQTAPPQFAVGPPLIRIEALRDVLTAWQTTSFGDKAFADAISSGGSA